MEDSKALALPHLIETFKRAIAVHQACYSSRNACREELGGRAADSITPADIQRLDVTVVDFIESGELAKACGQRLAMAMEAAGQDSSNVLAIVLNIGSEGGNEFISEAWSDCMTGLARLSMRASTGLVSMTDEEKTITAMGQTGDGVERTEKNGEHVPTWNKDTGELSYDGNVVKRIQNIGQAKNVVAVLNAFEECNWPVRIDDPLPGGADRQRAKETVNSLNLNLIAITFKRDGTGEGFRWNRQ